MKSSRLKGFFNLSVKERLEKVARWASLSDEEKDVLYSHRGYQTALADKMIENVAGLFPFPLAFAPNFKVNGKDYLVPMVIEEASVVAAASNAARYFRGDQGFEAHCRSSLMIGQIQLLDVPDLYEARKKIFTHEAEILKRGNDTNSLLQRLGGGLKRVEVRIFDEEEPHFMVVHLYVDVMDAMGANTVNTMCERVAPYVEELSGGRAGLKILSNLCESRVVNVVGRVSLRTLHADPEQAALIAQGIENASIFAERDPYRAVTHNKGIMNGIDSVLLATGQDWRAVEAGAHIYASRKRKYSALSTWRFRRKQRVLEGRMEIPMSVGVVGGITQVHPTVKIAHKIIGARSGRELAELIASVGLAQNFAAILALSTEGIQRGHMSLHSRNVAVAVGAQGAEIEEVSRQLIATGSIQIHTAKEILYDVRRKKSIEIALSAGAREEEVQEVAHSLFVKNTFKVSVAREILDSIRSSTNGKSLRKSS